jgi:hypothetical protein
MFKNLSKLLLDPYPFRTSTINIMRRLKLGSYQTRVLIGAVERPHYGYCVYHSAMLARRLGHKRISVVEFGVAGGAGLLNLEYHAGEVSKILNLEIEVYGFDTGKGLPAPRDYRDLPYHWKAGFYAMDNPKLGVKLIRAKLIIGDIHDTVKTFLQEYDPAPIAAVMHDFDFYTSTVEGLKLFDAAQNHYLPRVFCYFDDTIGSEVELYNDYTGERLAISEFNHAHEFKKIAKPYHLFGKKPVEPWYHQIFIFHDFSHSRYNDFISDENQQLPI